MIFLATPTVVMTAQCCQHAKTRTQVSWQTDQKFEFSQSKRWPEFLKLCSRVFGVWRTYFYLCTSNLMICSYNLKQIVHSLKFCRFKTFMKLLRKWTVSLKTWSTWAKNICFSMYNFLSYIAKRWPSFASLKARPKMRFYGNKLRVHTGSSAPGRTERSYYCLLFILISVHIKTKLIFLQRFVFSLKQNFFIDITHKMTISTLSWLVEDCWWRARS